jgi:hypothetical protein
MKRILVAPSVATSHDATPSWPAPLVRGTTVMIWLIPLAGVALALGYGLPMLFKDWIDDWVTATATMEVPFQLAVLAAVWLLTTPEPGRAEPSREGAVRVGLRWLGLAAAVGVVTHAAVPNAHGALSSTVSWLLAIARAASMALLFLRLGDVAKLYAGGRGAGHTLPLVVLTAAFYLAFWAGRAFMPDLGVAVEQPTLPREVFIWIGMMMACWLGLLAVWADGFVMLVQVRRGLRAHRAERY